MTLHGLSGYTWGYPNAPNEAVANLQPDAGLQGLEKFSLGRTWHSSCQKHLK